MRIQASFVAIVLALAFASPAFAAAKGSLAPGGHTIGGPGDVSLGAGGTERIFTHSGGGANDACVTVVNTGRVPVDIDVTGATSPTASVPVNGSETLCAEDVTAIDLVCPGENACNAQWRVDDN